jgi:2-polyprenyl-6-methoxyphenol hydroxylase-like FAD-dependent oxidoreductase
MLPCYTFIGGIEEGGTMDTGASSHSSDGKTLKVRCCIVGGGPAGMMLGYLFGRAGIDVVVLEKHADFFRDFRGDTVHPSTLQVMDELGLIDGFLKLPHQRLQKMDGLFGGATVRIADLSRLHVKYPFIAFMPQWDFLNFLRESGERFSSLKVMMNTEAVDLIRRGDAIAGVRAKTPEGMIDIEADLTVGCDGRHSLVRERAGLEVEEIGAPMDVLWFRAGKAPDEKEHLFARLDPGKMMVTFDRGDYWQCAYVIAKGQYDAVKARGLQALLDDVVRMAPVLKAGIAEVKSWDDVKLLTVAINRLKRWTRPGLLCIGDAAHAMSPVGGVGVNLAVQDAVATANILAAKLMQGYRSEEELDEVRKRREFPVRMTQRMQVVMQNNIISMALKPGGEPLRVPFAIRLVTAMPWLQGITARFIGIGVRPEHVRSPAAVNQGPAPVN